MIKKVVGRIVSFAELRGESDPDDYVVVSDEPDHDGPQLEVALAYTELKMRSVMHEPEWGEALTERILSGKTIGFFVEFPMTAEDILDDLID